MSLFDVIKYSLSDPPTEAEIAVLPQYLRDFIFAQCNARSSWRAAQLLYIYSRQPINKFRTRYIVETVRKSLLEM